MSQDPKRRKFQNVWAGQQSSRKGLEKEAIVFRSLKSTGDL